MNTPSLTRRKLLQGAGCLMAATMLPDIRVALANAPIEQRFIFVILRGAMDGLAAAPPYGDRSYNDARQGLALPQEAYTPLDNFFAVHANFVNFSEMFRAREAAIIHAVSTPYRERSHFDAQNVLESGGLQPHGLRDGWLNRTLSLYGQQTNSLGLAVGQTIPLALQGDTPVGTWAPSAQGLPPDTLMASLERLYRKDKLFHTALLQAADVHAIADADTGDMMQGRDGGGVLGKKNAAAIGKTVEAVGRILSDADGPRIATIEIGGWDTHAQQGKDKGQLANLFTALDTGMKNMKSSLGPHWKKTVVLVATEFGRTVAQNGTGGSDHGTGTCAFLLGGAVNGGKVYTDWPGLDRLYQNRDLNPTTDLRQVAKAILYDHLRLRDAEIESRVFPDSSSARALEGIIRT